MTYLSRARRPHRAFNEQWTSAGDRLLQDGRRSAGVRRTPSSARGSCRRAAGHPDEPWRPRQPRRETLKNRAAAVQPVAMAFIILGAAARIAASHALGHV